MTDLLDVLPNFQAGAYTHLLPSLEKHLITTSDLLSLDALDIAKRAQLPVLDVRRLIGQVLEALHTDLGSQTSVEESREDLLVNDSDAVQASSSDRQEVLKNRGQISLLDASLDAALGGGLRSGYVTEITGESGVGKTQFLLTLLLAAQLPAPKGLGRSSIYISTEAPLATNRLAQMLEHSPSLSALSAEERPTLEKVRAVPVGDLEAQDHILEYQLPAALDRFDVGLVVIDSVAANYRAEQGFSIPRDLADRASRLAHLGQLLRKLAVKHNVAIVVANQVSDRLDSINVRAFQPASNPVVHSSPTVISSSPHLSQSPPENDLPGGVDLSLDHQQRFFTGWGDAGPWSSGLKTPALGLAWSTQIGCRIALKMQGTRPFDADPTQWSNGAHSSRNIWRDEKARRYMKVVFSPWARGHDRNYGVEYEITKAGVCATKMQE